MGAFKLKNQLPKETQEKMDKILAIPAAQRYASETAFLTALTPYLYNEVIAFDANGLIVSAAGNDLPTGDSGFKKGALFTKKDASGNGLYVNTGDDTSAVWNLLDDLFAIAADGTAVNAVAASKVLTVSDLPTDNDTVSIGGVIYKFQSAIGVAVASTGTLTATGNAQNNETVVIGNKTYTFKTTLTEVKATGTLTATANAIDGARVIINGVTYTFRDTLAVANDVKIGSNASDSLDNLIAAINGAAGAGSTYGTGTVAHPDVTAAAGAGDTMVVTAKVPGVAGNAITTTEVSPGLAWGAATLGSGADPVANEVLIGADASGSLDNLIVAITGGAGIGTNYSTGTTAHTQVTAAAGAGDTMVVTALATGDAGNAIATTVTMANASWGNANLTGGETAQAANDVLIGVNAEACIDNLVAAINKATGEGTTYGTGTVANPLVTASKASASTMLATAKTKGVSGNSIAIAESGGNLAWAGGASVLSGGVDGTVSVANAILVDDEYIYIPISANTISDANWKKVSLQDPGTVTLSSNAGTINKRLGVITTEALNTGAGAVATFTITDSLVTTSSLIFVTVANGTNNAGHPTVLAVTPGNGSFTIQLKNGSGSNAFNGTLKLSFMVVNP